MTMAKYLVFVRNDKILAIPVENSSFYNKVRTKLIEALEGSHSIGFKTILVGFYARKIVIVDHDVELLMNLLSKTPFHCVVTTKSIPTNLGRVVNAPLSSLLDPLEGLSMLNYGKLEFEGRSRLLALKGVRGAC